MEQNSPQKLYDLTFEERDGYLFASVKGEADNFEVSAGYWQEVAEKCQRIGAKKVLIVEDLPGDSSMAEVYQLASALPQMGFYNIKVAFVDEHIDQQELNQFGELVAINRGLHGKIFNNVSEAEKWIEQN